jgi:NADH:ubiquinone oxidoreductase subunit C
MHGIFYLAKRDRRALFLVPLLYWAPLRKSFPASGFYELRLEAETQKLIYLRVSWAE